MNKQIKPAFKIFIDFSLITLRAWKKNAFLLRRLKMTPGSAGADEQSVLHLGKLGFPAAAPCRNKHCTRVTVKEEITYLHRQIPALFTVLVVIISRAVKDSAVSHSSLTDQIALMLVSSMALRMATSVSWSTTLVYLLYLNRYSMDCPEIL